MTRLAALLLLGSLLLAGCLQPQDAGSASAAITVDNTKANMTGRETQNALTVGPCASSSKGGNVCATRTVVAQGAISGIQKLDVDVRMVFGNTDLRAGAQGAWSVKAVLEARGATEEEAKRNLEALVFSWSHTDGSNHFLAAEVRRQGDVNHASARLDLALPPSVVWVLTGDVSYGNTHVRGIQTDGLSLHTSYGNAKVSASVTHVDVRSSYGNVELDLKPTASGRIQVKSSYGNAEVNLPEDAAHGYDLDLDASYGRATFGLRDGKTTGGPDKYGTGDHRHFTTNGYESRDIRTSGTIAASYGNLVVNG